MVRVAAAESPHDWAIRTDWLVRHGRKGVVPMVLSTRGVLALGLGVTALAILVGPSLGRQQDATVRKTAGPTGGTMPPAPVAPVIGTIDIDGVFKNYEKFKVASKDFNAAMLARKNDLMK